MNVGRIPKLCQIDLNAVRVNILFISPVFTGLHLEQNRRLQ